MRAISDTRRQEPLAAGQNRILEMVAGGAPLADALRAIIELIESGSPDMIASILLLDEDGVHLRHGAAGRLPAAYCRAIDGLSIGPRVGSCGTAMYRRETVICEDLATDPLWKDYRKLAARHGLRACWSTPIVDPQQRVLGSFALYFREPMRPRPRHRRLVETATHVAAIAIARQRAESERLRLARALSERESTFRSIFRNAAIGITLTDMRGNLMQCNPAFARMLGREEAELAGRHFADFTHPDDVAENLRLYDDLAAGRIDHFGMEKRYLRKDGGVVWVQLNVSSVEPQAGAAPFTIGMTEDISARNQAEQVLRESAQRFRSLAESSPDAILIHQDLRIVFVNRAMVDLMRARDAGELVGRPSTFMLPAEFVEPARRRSQGLYAGEPQPRVEQVYRRLDGTPVEVEIAAAPIVLDGKAAAQVTVRDITARRQAEAALRDSERRFRGILEGMTVGFVALNRDWRLTYVNPQAAQILGRSVESLLGKRYQEAFPEAQGSPFELTYRKVMTERVTVQHTDYFAPWQRWFEQRVDPAPDGISIFFQDVTERKKSESRIEYLATHDGLTDLPNRNLIHDRIAQAIAHARRAERQIAVMYIDLDRFKVINDGFGHRFGDALLRAAGERLASAVREGDTVARQSGDEFLVLLADLRKSTDVYIVAQKILELFARPFALQEREVHLTASVGVSLYPQDGQTPETLIGNADVAMYRAKDAGRNSYRFFTREMSEETQRRIEIETELRSAVARGQLHLVYQPRVDLATGRITACEALARWSHPALGPVPPARFIPVAEDSGLIVPIGDWVLRSACAESRKWQDAGLPPVVVSVNLSARQFLQKDVVAWVLRVLDESGLPPARLELELTESLIAQDADKAIGTLARLKEAGVRLAIDDFGTGYSSLNHLRRFRADTLKIDQSFIRHLESNVDDATIALAVISLAHNLRMTAVAEGVETEGQRTFLRLNRCDEIQGYLFSPPLAAHEMAAMLRGGERLPNRAGP
jgi:diguanylate cyclase (GGDEF)-like protein/PAS domain S-box-containing protein